MEDSSILYSVTESRQRSDFLDEHFNGAGGDELMITIHNQQSSYPDKRRRFKNRKSLVLSK